MKVDIGFWDKNGNYIPDIQEVSEVEMDKEIIIDGVNVGGCKYFQIEANTIYPKAHYCGSTFNRFCEDDDNCVYKQLKRLEQENAELKAEDARLKSCLQEIKAIAKEIADTENWLNCGYNASRAKKILDLIVKAEEE